MAGSILESNSSSTNFTDAWVLKLDSAGNITWKKAYGGESSDHEDSAEAIRQTTDGGYVLTGNTESSGAGKTDIWVLKLDESGEIDGCGVVKALESVEKLDPAPSINTAVPALVVTGTTIIGSSTAATVVEATLTQDGPCGPLVVEGIIDLPVTGQTECYDSSNGVIDCTDTGQDGEYQMGVAWPVPRFTVNGEGTIITDRLTGLSWATDAGMPSLGDGACAGGVLGEKTWQGALDYIECLNSGTGSTTFDGDYLGHNDWRLPNENELFSLINFGHSDPVYSNSYWLEQQGFSSFVSVYWSSTTAVPYWDNSNTISGGAWMAALDDGTESPGDKTGYRRYTPVRDAVGPPAVQLPRTGKTKCHDDEGWEIDCTGTGQDGEYQKGDGMARTAVHKEQQRNRDGPPYRSDVDPGRPRVGRNARRKMRPLPA